MQALFSTQVLLILIYFREKSPKKWSKIPHIEIKFSKVAERPVKYMRVKLTIQAHSVKADLSKGNTDEYR